MIKSNHMVALTQIVSRLNHKNTRFLPKTSLKTKIFLALAIILSLRIAPQIIHSQSQTLVPGTMEYYKEAERQGSQSGTFEFLTNNGAGSLIQLSITSLGGDLDNAQDIIDQTRQMGYYTPKMPGGMIGSINSLNSKLYRPPASGVEYIADTVGNFLGKPAYAQGVGFAGLQSILPIWKGFRNIVYLLASVILIFIGLMVMLRIKISPQAVVTIQSALPQLVITLILVTFSYAIAGLLIDFSYFLQATVLAILFTALKGGVLTANLIDPATIFGIPIPSGIPSNFATLSQASLFTIGNIAQELVPTTALISLGVLVGGIVGGLIGAIAGNLPGAGAGALIGGLVGPFLIVLIFLILILFWIIKLFFGLVKCYVTLIFKIIIGPLEIGMGAFPSAKLGFNTWLTDVIANLAVFPITLLFMVVAAVIVRQSTGGLWAPTLLRSSVIGETVNGIANIGGGLVPIAIGLGALMLMAQLPELIIQAVFMLKPSAWDTAIGKASQLETLPVFGGMYKTVKGGIERKQQDAVGSQYAAYSGAVDTYISNKFKATKLGQKLIARRKPEPAKEGEPGTSGASVADENVPTGRTGKTE